MKDDNEFVQYIVDRTEKLGLPEKRLVATSVHDLSGNINRVRRVRLVFDDDQTFSFIVKHLPEDGKLERYPEVAFPKSRLRYEVLWNRTCSERLGGAEVRPAELLDHDPEYRTLIFEDLGTLPSVATVLRSAEACESLVKIIASFLGTFHGETVDLVSIDNPAACKNRPFVLTLPLNNPDLIQELWRKRRITKETSEGEKQQIKLQQWFLDTHKARVLPILRRMEGTFKNCFPVVLTHGDLHGESLLVMPDGGLAVLDAELCDSGTPAFDVGTIMAHIIAARMSSLEADLQAVMALVEVFLETYESALLRAVSLDQDIIKSVRVESLRYTGAELIRRSIGAAPFPGIPSIRNPCALLGFAADLICHGDISVATDAAMTTHYR